MIGGFILLQHEFKNTYLADFQSGCERWGFHLFTQQVKTIETWGPVLTTGPTIHRDIQCEI